MSTLTAVQLAQMREAQRRHMGDTVHILERVRDTDPSEFGRYDGLHWASVGAVTCGFKYVRKYEQMGASKVPAADAICRLSQDVDLESTDRLLLVCIAGEALADPETYEVLAGPRIGPTGLVVELKRVTDGTDQ